MARQQKRLIHDLRLTSKFDDELAALRKLEIEASEFEPIAGPVPAGYAEYQNHLLREVARSLGIPPELTMDLDIE